MRTIWMRLLLPSTLAFALGPIVLWAQTFDEPAPLPAVTPTIEDAQIVQVGHSARHPNAFCEPVCCPRCVTEEVEKSCWLVKPELVCIPGFRWPWECCDCDCRCNCSGGEGCSCACPPPCGRVRCVNVLEKHKYTCKECGYEWDIKWVRSRGVHSATRGNCPKCGRGANFGPCASAESPGEVQLTGTAEALAAPQVDKPAPTFWEKLGLK